MKGPAESGHLATLLKDAVEGDEGGVRGVITLVMTQLLTIKNRISSVIIGGWGWGGGAPPPGSPLAGSPRLPVTLRLTQGIMTPPNPPVLNPNGSSPGSAGEAAKV
jgi:hypothetical protein